MSTDNRYLEALGMLRKESANPFAEMLSKITNPMMRRTSMRIANKLSGVLPAKGLSTPKLKTSTVQDALASFKRAPAAAKNQTPHIDFHPDNGHIDAAGSLVKQEPSFVSDRDILLAAAIEARNKARISRNLEAGAKTFPALTNRIRRKPLTGITGEIYFDKSGKGVKPKYSAEVGRDYEITGELPFKTFSRRRWMEDPGSNGVVWDDITGSGQYTNPLSEPLIERINRLIYADLQTRLASKQLQKIKYNKLGVVPGQKR